MSSLLAELQRRNVHRAAVFYAGSAWLVVQVATQVFPFFHIDESIVRAIVVASLIGFPFALAFSWFYEWTPQGIKLESEVERSESVTRATGRRLDRGIIAVLSLAVVLLLANALLRHREDKADAANVAANDRSIAVLPFENLSADPANAFFAVGIQDEILTRLAKVGALKVISRTSTAHFASSPDDLPAIAKRLGVSAILEGSVQKAGELVHINVQLIRAASDEHLWAESYNRKLDDIFGVEGEVAQSIAEALSATLTGAEKQQLEQKPTLNPQAYEAYLRGLVYDGHFTASKAEFEAWAGAYEQATQLDPNFAAAWAGLARAYVEWYFQIDTTPQRLAMAKSALDQAQRLAPDAEETWDALGLYRYWGLNDFDGALQAYGEALKRKPSSAGVLTSMGNVRRRQNHWEDALSLQQRAATLDPLNAGVAYNLSLTYLALGRVDEAQRTVEQGLAVAPGDTALMGERVFNEQARGDLKAAHAFAEQLPLDSADVPNLTNRFDEWRLERDSARAIAEIGSVLEHTGRFSEGSRAFLLWYLGRAESASGATAQAHAHFMQAKAIIDTLQRAGDLGVFGGIVHALLQAELGDFVAADREMAALETVCAKDALVLPSLLVQHAQIALQGGDKVKAITLLARAQAMPSPFRPFPALLRLDPQWDALRGDPAFDRLTQNQVATATGAAQ